MSDRIPDPYSGQGLNEAVAADQGTDERSETRGSSRKNLAPDRPNIPTASDDPEPAVPAGTSHGCAAEAASIASQNDGLVAMGQRSNAGVNPTGADAAVVDAYDSKRGRTPSRSR